MYEFLVKSLKLFNLFKKSLLILFEYTSRAEWVRNLLKIKFVGTWIFVYTIDICT